MNHSHLFWSIPVEELCEKLHTSPQGLNAKEVIRRQKKWGRNVLKNNQRHTALSLFFAQFKSPLMLLLIAAAILSLILMNRTDACIILSIVIISSALSFFQEYKAHREVEELISLVKVKVQVLRDGKSIEIPLDEVVPGDVVSLAAGDMVPGDCLLLECKDCFVDEATLTGESFNVEKTVGVLSPSTPLAKRTNTLFMGSHVVSGFAKAIVVVTGKLTEFGKISERLKFRPPETSFERGVRHFGQLLMEVTLIFVIAIFAFNIYLQRPVLESFLFAVALAVGFTPQLLPAIVTINLSHGARKMAASRVIVKRLSSIENLGAMEVLCTDKTGTITHGVISLSDVCDVKGTPSPFAKQLAYLNAAFQTGYSNPIDKAILQETSQQVDGYQKLDEIPYDFIRKRLSVLVQKEKERLLISKGAFHHMLDTCTQVRLGENSFCPLSDQADELEKLFQRYCMQGYRVLAVAYKPISQDLITRKDESELIFAGFILFYDPPKEGISDLLKNIQNTKVSMKILTGDHSLVAAHLSSVIGLLPPQEEGQSIDAYLDAHVLRGEQIHKMSNRALLHQVQEKSVFAELEPHQKERIILALRKEGNVVGYMGDGINDATALHAADVGISVDLATDVVKDVADIVLLKKDLSALLGGVQEGRRTFANTMKYIFMATSANFGNMFSMAGVSLIIPFLPLLPKQILLTNLLTDVPEMAIATDTVDLEVVAQPVRWDMGFIRRFMIVFGLLSSIFDFLTFGVLLHILKAQPGEFRTGWFLESVASAAMIVLVVRTKKPFWRSRPSPYLISGVFGSVIVTAFLPFTPLAQPLGFVPLPPFFYAMIAIIVTLYILSAELAKTLFYRKPKTAFASLGQNSNTTA